LRYLVSADLGQVVDFSTIAVTEDQETDQPRYIVRHLERFPIRTEYPVIARSIVELVRTPPLDPSVPVIIDAGGPGRPVIDLLREAGLSPVVVTTTNGTSVTRDSAGAYRVPHVLLGGIVKVAFEGRHVQIAAELPDAHDLEMELRAFTVRQTAQGRLRFGARDAHVHDDRVASLALALWYATAHAGIPMVHGFHAELHVAPGEPGVLEAMPNIPIVRGWRLTPPHTACVAFQIWDRGKSVQVLYEWPPGDSDNVASLRDPVTTASNTLWPEFQFHDYVEPEAFELLAGGASTRRRLDTLRSWVLPRRGEPDFSAQLAALHTRLTTYHGRRVAFQVDPGCYATIRALEGGLVERVVQGRRLGVPRMDEHYAIVFALGVALAARQVTMTPSERASIMGPKVLQPDW
jgi:hypothetical protein